MALLILLTILVAGSLADHRPFLEDYGLPNSQVNFHHRPSNTYKIPEVVSPVLPSFIEIGTSAPKPAVKIPSTSYGVPAGHVNRIQAPALRPSTKRPTKPSIIYGTPEKPATEYYVPTTTTTIRPTTRTTTTTRAPTTPSVEYGTPEKPTTKYFVPTTTTTTTPKPTTTTTTITTTRPTTTPTTTTTKKEVEVYGPPGEKPPKPFDDYGPPHLPHQPFDKITERPSYPYPAAGVPDPRHHHQGHGVHLVPYFVRHVPNPYFRISAGPHIVPVHTPKYFFL